MNPQEIHTLSHEAAGVGFGALRAQAILQNLGVTNSGHAEVETPEGERDPLSLLDHGFVYIDTIASLGQGDEAFSEIRYTETGVPIPVHGHHLPYAQWGDHYLAFPGNILKWSAGRGYDPRFENPVKQKDNPIFDIERRAYRPSDSLALQIIGYTEEGIRRQAMLGLMSAILSHANGAGNCVRLNPDLCQIAVMIPPHISRGHAKTQVHIDAVMLDLWGIKASIANSDMTLPLHQALRDGDGADTNHFMAALTMCKIAIDNALSERLGIIDSARRGANMFS